MPENKPLDSSARNLLIYIGLSGGPSGLRPVRGGEGWRENTQEPAQTRGSRQKKANRLGLAFKVLVASRNMNANAISSLKWRLEQRQVQQTNLFGTPQRPCEGL
jgi:hypothetical protein